MFLVCDVGGTFIKYAWMTSDGEIREKGKVPTKSGKENTIADLINPIGEVYDRYKTMDEIEGIALSVPGQVDVDTGMVYRGGAISYLHKQNLQELVSNRCDHLPVSVENDGKCAALAEVWKGNAKDVRNACVVVFGTGIGGGIVIDRKIHRGNRLIAGEVSWALQNMVREDINRIVPEESIKNIEESIKCLSFTQSAQCSTSGMVCKVAWAKGLPYSEVNGEKIFQWIEEGDQEVIDIVEDVYFNIAKLCINLYVEFDPDIILVGGGISAQPTYIEGIRRYVNELKRITNTYDGIQIDVCKYRSDSNLLGALYNYKQKYGEIED